MITPSLREPDARHARRRKIENIRRACEQKKAELQANVSAPALRSPVFYLGMILVLAALGAWLFGAADRSRARREDSPHLVALRHLDVLAEALGRYRFHTGRWPAREQGLAALVRDPHAPGWDGPYINLLRADPWGTPFVYEASDGQEPPGLFSCGPDRRPGTPDDLRPDPARFDPGAAWTNEWVSSDQRLPGVNILQEWPTR